MKQLALYMILAALLFTAGAVRAEENGTVGRRPEMPRPGRLATTTPRGERKDPRFATSTRMQMEREDFSNGTSTEVNREDENRGPNAPQIGNMLQRFDATFDRMQNLINRTESRVEKMKTNGFDTTNAEKAVSTAKSKLLDAQTIFESLKNATATSTPITDASSTPARLSKDAIKGMKKAADRITKDLKDIQTGLLKALAGFEGKGNSDKNSDQSNEQSGPRHELRRMGSSTPERLPEGQE